MGVCISLTDQQAHRSVQLAMENMIPAKVVVLVAHHAVLLVLWVCAGTGPRKVLQSAPAHEDRRKNKWHTLDSLLCSLP